ncbi:hypothetical protein AAC387_Pa09g0547 [Persea americana]
MAVWLHDDAPLAKTAATSGLLIVFSSNNPNQYKSSDLNIVSKFSYPRQLLKLKSSTSNFSNRDDTGSSVSATTPNPLFPIEHTKSSQSGHPLISQISNKPPPLRPYPSFYNMQLEICVAPPEINSISFSNLP